MKSTVESKLGHAEHPAVMPAPPRPDGYSGPGKALVPFKAPGPEPVRGEVLPPGNKSREDYELTRTAKKRAMRQAAQEYAEEAIRVLATNLKSPDPEIAAKAANDMLKWGGFAAPDLDGVNPDGLQIAIIRFGEQP